MDTEKQPILRIPESVRQDVLGYREGVCKFLAGETKLISFKAYRVPMGIYEQRDEGKYMVRIRIGAGLVRPFQLERIAELSKKYGNGILHVTTRQDIQIHEVDIENTPDVLEGLLEVGLSARGGGGNTVRNVTACPRAGICQNEEFDVAPYAIATAEYLLQFKSSFNLPRKFKIVFSGCSFDCAFASVADLGFFAHKKDGVKGFAVYAGGGLGPNPMVAIKVEDFIADSEVLETAEAIKKVFDAHGDRSNKHKARLRYVLRRVGEEEFIELYKNARAEVRSTGLEGDIPRVRDIDSGFEEAEPVGEGNKPADAHYISPEKKEGLFTIKLGLKLGDIPADDLIKVGQIAQEFGQGLVRTNQLQNLLITSVPRRNVEKVISALGGLSIEVLGNGRPGIIACAGAATCKLGLCLSRGLADAISDNLNQDKASTEKPETTIRISGCPNSCGNHYIADIGFQGKALRVNGNLIPFYDVLVGAKTIEGQGRLAEVIGTVPAKRIPQLVAEAFSNGGDEIKQIKSLVAKYSEIGPEPLPEDYSYDFGASELFSLAGRGPGECGAGVMDVIKVDIDEAKEAIKSVKKLETAKDKSEIVYKAIVSAARSLLITFGLEPKKDREIFAAFGEHLIEPGWFAPQTQELLNEATDWRMGDSASIDDLADQAEEMVERAEALFFSLDANLKFKIEPVAQETDTDENRPQNRTIDLRGVTCPLNFVKAKIELEKVAIGEILDVILNEGDSVKNVPESFTQQGQEVIEVKKSDEHYCVSIRRKR